MSEQLVLPLNLNFDLNFDTFVWGENEELVKLLKNILCGKEYFIYISASKGLGKSHLLQATYLKILEESKRAFYLDLRQQKELSPSILDDLEINEVICLDNCQAIAGKKQWEEALLYLYNRVRAIDHYMIVTANQPAQHIIWELPDLKSRLNWGLTYHLHPLNDEQKIDALSIHAQLKGMRVNREVWKYILNNYGRGMTQLMNIFLLLEKKSLVQKKRITIPFVKRVLGKW